MKETIIALLSIFLLLTSCAAPQASVDTPVPPMLTAPITVTPRALTGTPVIPASSQPPGILSILRLQMIDSNVGWAEGADSNAVYLLRTTDGGETWQDVTPPTWFVPSDANGAYGVDLSAINANTAWAISSGRPFSDSPLYTVVWRTTDGGRSWMPGNPISTVSGSGQSEFSPWLQFVDEKHGWLTLHFQQRIQSNDLQYRTSDGGITWEGITGCATWDGAKWGCDVPQFTDSQTGWLRSPPDYTSNGDVMPASIWRVQRTQDGGRTWKNITLPHSREAAGCYQSFNRVGVGIVGMRVDCTTMDSLTESYYYLSDDQGRTWQIIPLPGKAFSLLSPISAYETAYYNVTTTANVFFLNMMTGWRLSAPSESYQLERTTDGGATWQTMSDHLDWKEGFQFVDANTGWQVVPPWEAASDSRIQLLRTRDGGKTWQNLTPRLLPAEPDESTIARLDAGYSPVFESIKMIDSSNGWAIGANGYIFRTVDGGKAWQDVTPLHGYIRAHREFFALDARRAWTTVSSPSKSIWPTPEAIWSTSDGGQSWHQLIALSEGQSISPGSLYFLSENIGWFQLTSLRGETQEVRLMKTRDQGVTWEVQSTGQYSYYVEDRMGFMFLDEQNGFRIEPVKEHTLEEFLSNSLTLISKTTDGGVTWQPVDLPKMVLDIDKLSLNKVAYPNGLNELLPELLGCEETALHIFSSDTIGMRVICRGAYRDVYGTYGYGFLLIEYYLSTDGGASWNNWMSVGRDFGKEDFDEPVNESEFFLPGGTGWRLSEIFFLDKDGWRSKANHLLETVDGGRTWTILKTVNWREARLDFINVQEGWAIANSWDGSSLLHTMDGGKTWEEIKPLIANP